MTIQAKKALLGILRPSKNIPNLYTSHFSDNTERLQARGLTIPTIIISYVANYNIANGIQVYHTICSDDFLLSRFEISLD